MKALSIQQPWAHYILRYGKDVENRSWPTNVRGKVFVHAGKRWDGGPEDGVVYGDRNAPDLPAADFTLGALVGVVEIVDCVLDSHSIWAEPGCFHFVLANPVVLPEPIPYRGQLGFFDVPHEVVEQARGQFRQDGREWRKTP